MDKWQPIETAPRDTGRHILGFITEGPSIRRCSLVISWRRKYLGDPTEPEWRLAGTEQGGLTVTHWMPLPEPPISSNSESTAPDQ